MKTNPKLTQIGRPTLAVVKKMFPERHSQRNVDKYFPMIEAALDRFNIELNEVRLVAYASIRAETADFKPKRERPQLGVNQTMVDGKATWKYENKKEHGHTSPGDGERYRGSGFIQLTWKDQYERQTDKIGYLKMEKTGQDQDLRDIYAVKCTIALGYVPKCDKAEAHRQGAKIAIDLKNDPEQANEPEVAALVLASFIHDRYERIGNAILRFNYREARRAVNGGSNGIRDFIDAYQKGYVDLGGRLPTYLHEPDQLKAGTFYV